MKRKKILILIVLVQLLFFSNAFSVTITINVDEIPLDCADYTHDRLGEISISDIIIYNYFRFYIQTYTGNLTVNSPSVYVRYGWPPPDNFVYYGGDLYQAFQDEGTLNLLFGISKNNRINNRYRVLKLMYKTWPPGFEEPEIWSSKTFVVRVEDINVVGSDLVCSSGYQSYTVPAKPSGSTCDWTKSSNLSFYSQGDNNCQVYATSSSTRDDGWVDATVDKSTCTWYASRKDFWVGRPLDPEIWGSDEIYCEWPEWYFVDNDSRKWGNFDWSTSYHLNILGITNGYKAQIESNIEEDGLGCIYLEVSNTCGTSYENKYVDIICGFFMMMPNPADDYVEISADQSKLSVSELSSNGGFIVNVYDTFGTLTTNKSTKDVSLRIDTSKLPDGIYVLNIIYNSKTYSKELVIKH